MAEMWSTESVLKKHGLWRELAGPPEGPTAIKLHWQDMQIARLEAENAELRKILAAAEEAIRFFASPAKEEPGDLSCTNTK